MSENKLKFILEEAYKEGQLLIQEMDGSLPVTTEQINQTNEKMCQLVNQFIQIKKIFNQQQANQIAEEMDRMTALKKYDEEGTRKLISDMLHHDIAQMLYAISLKLEFIDRTVLKSYEQNFLKQFDYSLKELLKHATKLASDIYPAMIDDLGVTSAIRSYAKNLEKNLNNKLIVELSEKLDFYAVELQHVIFRVCRCLFNYVFENDKQIISTFLQIDELDSCIVVQFYISGSNLSLDKSLTSLQCEQLDKTLGTQHLLTDNLLKLTYLIPLSS